MTSAITEMIYTIAIVVAAATVAGTYIQNTSQLNGALNVASQNVMETAMTSIKTIFATELSDDVAEVWVKNVGTQSIDPLLIAQFDVFFGPEGNFEYIPYNRTSLPKWDFTIVSDNGNTDFDPGETLDIKIYLDYSLSEGDYYFRIVTYNGVGSEYSFSL